MMKLEILLSCMNQEVFDLVHKSGLTGDVTVINQSNREDYCEFDTRNGKAKVYTTVQRGLTKSRNMAIEKSCGDVCLLCDDDECFVSDYEHHILNAYNCVPNADIIVFKMINRPAFGDTIKELKFFDLMKVSSWQISFKRQSLLENGLKFDELLGAGTENGAEEELKFLLDCRKAGLKIYYHPTEIAYVAQSQSTWFIGFNETFFLNRGATTRYILGLPLSCLYAVYYLIKKRKMYNAQITFAKAAKFLFKGIFQNKISKQARKNRI